MKKEEINIHLICMDIAWLVLVNQVKTKEECLNLIKLYRKNDNQYLKVINEQYGAITTLVKEIVVMSYKYFNSDINNIKEYFSKLIEHNILKVA